MTSILGSGKYTYRELTDWAKLPEGWAFIDAVDVAVDSQDRVYVFNRGEHPVMVFERDGRRFRLAEFSQELREPDWCLRGHLGYILEGILKIDFNGTEETFAAGQGFYIPAGPEHKHMASVPSGVVRLILVDYDA